MKKIIGKIISMQCILILITSCNLKGNASDNKNKSCDTLITETFDSFSNKFYSDSIFQISRIIFPLQGYHNVEVEVSESNPIGDSIIENWNKQNWKMLKTSFKNNSDTSITDCYGHVYIRKILKTATTFIDSIYIEDSDCSSSIKFVLMNNKWFLKYYSLHY
jgi:hypothetical protein